VITDPELAYCVLFTNSYFVYVGLSVNSVDKGVNGMLVVAVAGSGCIARDGRIVPGDYLLSVNNESLRKVTNSQARAILRRTQLLSTDIRYIITELSPSRIHVFVSLV
jgi:C-terminal processing protease CtpA/Prc